MNTPGLTITENFNHKSQEIRNYLTNAKPSIVVAHLKASHWRYEYELIPRIEQNFVGLIKLFPQLPSLPVIFNLFIKFQLAMKIHITIEEKKIYKAYLANSRRANENNVSHEDEEPFLNEIIALLKKERCLSNPFCRTLIVQLERFEAELIEHAWIEENIVNKKIQKKDSL